MKRVRVLGLTACSWCNALKKELDAKNIPYSFIDVGGENEIADHAEELLETENYPITIIDNGDASYYVYRADNIFQVGTKKLKDGSMKHGTLTLEGLMEGINLFLNW